MIDFFIEENQRIATRKAGEMVGLQVLKVFNEPSAAAMAYGLFVTGTKIVLVFDWGGGTIDVSLMKISEGKFTTLVLFKFYNAPAAVGLF